MTDARTNRFPLVVTLLVAGSLSLAAEPNAVPTRLVFEPCTENVPWFGEGSLRPSHAAGITLYQPPDAERASASLNEHYFLRSCLEGYEDVSFSQGQEAFLHAMEPALGIYTRRGRMTASGSQEDDPNYYHMVLHAMSPQDARKMAEAYVGFLRRQSDDKVRIANHMVERLLKKIASLEKRIPELDETLETSRERLDELMGTVLYRTEDEALAAIGELNRMINAARVDIAGIKAKIEAIQAPPAGKRTPEIASRLEAMFVEEAIALRAAEARKREATDLRAQAASYIDLNRTIKSAAEEKKSLAVDLRDAPTRLNRYRAELAKRKEQEPKVLDNKVFIYPVSPLIGPAR